MSHKPTSRYVSDDEDFTPHLGETANEFRDQYGWLLNRFTAEAWEVSNIEEKPEGSIAVEMPIIAAVISHESGSIIQVVPTDTERADHDEPLFDSHRVRLQNRLETKTEYITLDEQAEIDAREQFSIGEYIERDTHPYSEAADKITHHKQTAVHERDANSGTKTQTIPAIGEMTIAIFGAAQAITAKHTEQTGISSFL